MAKDQLTELVFIAPPGMGHLRPTVQIAEMLIARSSNRISAVIPIMKSPFPDDKVNSYIKSLKSYRKSSNGSGHEQSQINFLELPPLTDQAPMATKSLSPLMQSYSTVVEQALLHRYQGSSAPQLSGFILDVFCTGLMDVADKLGAPSYIFFTSGASFLSLMFHLESLNVDIPAEYGDRSPDDTVIEVAGFKNPVPLKVWPSLFLDKDGGSQKIFAHAARFRRAKGIMVNTFMEFESSLIQSLSSTSSDATTSHGFGQIPPIYPVGPIINTNDDSPIDNRDHIMNWLDSQPDSSVVFLCFGSRGSFNEEQIKEIAAGLERSGQRFLWSLRKQTGNSNKEGKSASPVSSEFDEFDPVLPEGFLDRTANVGKVIGWAPQVAVLSHKAVGAFLSHCGWNSTLESLWFGVPILAWPMFAEQQLNAFLLVKELGLAVEIKMNYQCDPRKGVANMIVKAEEVAMGIKKMMEEEEGEIVRQKVKEISKAGRKALLGEGGDGGSSYQSIRHFLENLHRNNNAP